MSIYILITAFITLTKKETTQTSQGSILDTLLVKKNEGILIKFDNVRYCPKLY